MARIYHCRARKDDVPDDDVDDDDDDDDDDDHSLWYPVQPGPGLWLPVCRCYKARGWRW